MVVAGWPESAAMALGGRRPETKKTGTAAAIRASRVDSLHGEDEDDEAEGMAGVDLHGGFPSSGVAAAAPAGAASAGS